jgi:hypothetical protein
MKPRSLAASKLSPHKGTLHVLSTPQLKAVGGGYYVLSNGCGPRFSAGRPNAPQFCYGCQ